MLYNKNGEKMKIFIGTDHRGVDVEKQIINYLNNKGYEVVNSTIEHSESDDYPDFAFDICKQVVNNPGSFGILMCGTGIGMSIAANKVKGIRAARCVNKSDAHYARIHNDANVICLGINDLSKEELCSIINSFIEEKEVIEPRHVNRVNKIINYENRAYNEL